MSVYGKGYFVTEEQIEKFDEKAMMEAMLLEAANDGMYSITEANFNILGNFKKTPALRKYENVAQDAQDLLMEHNMDRTYGEKIIRCIARFFDILDDIVVYTGTAANIANAISGLINPVLIPIGYLVNRLENWALRWGQEKLAIKECDKTLTKLNAIKK